MQSETEKYFFENTILWPFNDIIFNLIFQYSFQISMQTDFLYFEDKIKFLFSIKPLLQKISYILYIF